MLPRYTVGYINPDRLGGELRSFSIDSAQTQTWTFTSPEALLIAINAADFDCVIVENLSEGEALELECALRDAGRFVPVVHVTSGADIAQVIDGLHRGRGLWDASHTSRPT